MRKPFLDNLRCAVVLLVIVYHGFYLFNSVGVISSVNVQGIPALDVVEYVLYPWFMACLFAVAGIGAFYALQKRGGRAFLRERARRLLVPGVGGVFLLGWVSGWVADQYADPFGAAGAVPLPVRYLVCCLVGIGPLWFLHQLFAACCVLLALRRLDKGDRFRALCGRAAALPGWALAAGLVLPAWGAAQLLNTPLIELYRNGFYIFWFLAGYCLFSHEGVQQRLAGSAPALCGAAGVGAVLYTARWFGQNYAAQSCLRSFSTNLYAAVGVAAALAAAVRWFDRETRFTRWLRPRSFGFYVLHYPLMAVLAWLLCERTPLPMAAVYPVLLALEAALLPPLTALVRRTPVVRTLLLGDYTK